MRLASSVVVVCILLLAGPSWGKRPPQSSTSQPTSDPQAVAIVQAAITALGGATAIGQPQSWTFQAQLQGPYVSSSLTYVASVDTTTSQFAAANGPTVATPPIHSYFVPALIGRILLQESQDTRFAFGYIGTGNIASQPVSIITVTLTDGSLQFPAQIWAFNANNLPIQVDFRLPSEIGARRSYHGIVSLSNYQTVGGALYPFSIMTRQRGWALSEIITVQSMATATAAPFNEFNGSAGDLR